MKKQQIIAWVQVKTVLLCLCFGFNHFTAPACKNVWAEWCTDVPANSLFFGPITSTFNAMHFDEILLHASVKKENKKAYGFKFCTF